MINISGTNIANIYVGDIPISEAYIGSDLVYSAVEKPYDKQLQYLQSDGTAYIDLGFTPTLSYRMDLQFCFVGSYDTTASDSASLFGRISAWNSKGWAVAGRPASNVIYNCWGNKFLGYTNASYFSTTFKSWTTLSFHDKKMYINGTQRGSTSSGTGNPNGHAYLFCINNNGTPYGIGTQKRLRNIKIYNDSGTLVFDGIPVRKNGVGYMYDKVSGDLFGNAGTGSFTLGPDVT